MLNRRIRRISLVLVLAASLNFGWQFYQMHEAAMERQRIFEDSEYRLIACYLGPSVDQWARLYIELCVITAFVGSWMKGFKGLIFAVSGLTGAAIIYIQWRHEYLRLVEMAGQGIEVIENIGGLMGANYLDVAVAATIAVLMLVHFYDALLRFRTINNDA